MLWVISWPSGHLLTSRAQGKGGVYWCGYAWGTTLGSNSPETLPRNKATFNRDIFISSFLIWVLHYIANKGPSCQIYGFSSSHIQMGELDHKEGWALKNWWCWRRLSIVPRISKKSNQSIQEEIHPEYSLEGLMLKLKLKLQYFGHLMQRADSLEKTLMLGKIEDRRRRGWQDGGMASPIQWTWIWANSRRWWRTGKQVVLQSLGLQSGRRLNDWTTTTSLFDLFFT